MIDAGAAKYLGFVISGAQPFDVSTMPVDDEGRADDSRAQHRQL